MQQINNLSSLASRHMINPRSHDTLRYLGILKDRTLTGPQRLEIEINSYCNLNCLFCWFHSPGTKIKMKRWELPYNKFQEIIIDASQMGIKHLYITGRGEPCLHPRLPDMLRYAKKNGLSITLTTNFSVITKKILAAVSLIDMLEITFCGWPAEKYKELQCPNNKNLFDAVVKNISLIGKISALNGKPFIKINYVLTNKNIDSLDGFIKFCGSLGVQGIRLSPLSFTPETNSLKLSHPQMKRLKRKFVTYPCSGKPHIDTSWFNLRDIKIKGCYMGWETALVGIYGKVKIGCFDSPLASEGNICKTPLKKIWFSKRSQTNRLKLKYSLNTLKFCPFYSQKLKRNGTFCPFSLENARIEQKIEKTSLSLK